MEKRGKGQDGGGRRKVRRSSRRVQALRHGGSVWRDKGRGPGEKKKEKKRHQDEKRKSQ